MAGRTSRTSIKTVPKDKNDQLKSSKIIEIGVPPTENSVRHRIYTSEVSLDMSNGSVDDGKVDYGKSKSTADDVTHQIKQTRRLSLKEILPIYVNQILPSESHDYPLISYERTYGPGYLYVLCESNFTGTYGQYYKVGVTNDLKKRLRDLQNGNPRPLIPVRLIKVRNMESIDHFLSTNLKPLSVGYNGGKDWYCSKETDGKNALLEVIDLVKGKVNGLEIPPEKFRDYVEYFIYFSNDF